MSSVEKTSVLKLNQWAASDKPQRTDFNYDNEMIEKALCEHMSDAVSHITAQERSDWSSRVHFGMYLGDGKLERTVTTSCPFEPLFVVVFPVARPMSYSDFSQGNKYNYVGFATQLYSSINISLVDYGKSFKVEEDIAPSYKNEFTCLNQSGITYVYVMIR